MSTFARRTAVLAATAAVTALSATTAMTAFAEPSPSPAVGLHQVGRIDSAASQLAVDPARNRLYAAKVNGRVQLIDGATNTLVGFSGRIDGLGPDAVAADPSNNRAFATGVSSGTVFRIDGTTGAVQSTTNEAATYQGIAVDPRTDAVYVGNTNMVEKIDGDALVRRAVATLPGGGFNFVDDLAVNPANGRLYVTDREAVHVLDATTLGLVRTVPLTGGPDQVAVSSATGRVYVTGFGGVTVLSAGGAVLATVPIRATPFDVAVNVATGRAYVTSHNDGANHGFLSEIDAGNTVVATALVEGPPGYLAVNSRTNTTYVQAFPTFRLTPKILVFTG